MKRFQVREYRFPDGRIAPGEELTFCVISDLHGLEFGTDNGRLKKAILGLKPDAVLLSGDMQVRKDPRTLAKAAGLLKEVAEIYPVYYGLGNHESRMKESLLTRDAYFAYEEELMSAGVRILSNTSEAVEIKGHPVRIYGLELPTIFYRKPFSPKLTQKELKRLIGEPDPKSIKVLLAHNPKYADTYISWGADLVLSGHYHGGMLRFGEHVGAISPQLRPFPPYCCGEFSWGSQHMVVSAGLGEHTLPIRIHNPRELILVRLQGKLETK